MSELDLRELRAELEQNIDLPDFAVVRARGRQIRRRRRALVGAGAALVIAVLAGGVTQQLSTDRSLGPVERPHRPAPHGAELVLSDPAAQVDVDRSAVNDRGDVLSVVVVPTRTFGSGGDPCHTDLRSAFRWVGSTGATVDWSDASILRPVRAARGGFVVGPVPRRCRTGAQGEADAYLVDRNGEQRTVRDDRPPTPDPPAGATAIPVPAGDLHWAHSDDGRRLYWSEDGTVWEHRDTSLPPTANVMVTVVGDRAAFTSGTEVESTDDGGRTWQTRDLTAALRSIRIADVSWTLTRSGNLIGVTTLVGQGDLVFRSTDASWSSFRPTRVRTDFGGVAPRVVAGIVYVEDVDGWLVSDDDGATWRRVSPLG
jgi:hypothetical protein